MAKDFLVQNPEDIVKKPVPSHPSEWVAATWGAAAELQLQEIQKAVEAAKIDVDRVHAYATSAIEDIEHTVKECQREAARTLNLYKLGVYDGADAYRSVEEHVAPEPVSAAQLLRNDGPLTKASRDAARANRVANRPVVKWLGAAVVAAGTAVAGMYGLDAYLPKPVEHPIPPASQPEILRAPEKVQAEPRLSKVEIVAEDPENVGVFIYSKTPVVIIDGKREHYGDFHNVGEFELPEGEYSFLAGWRDGVMLRSSFTVKYGVENKLTLPKPKKRNQRET